MKQVLLALVLMLGWASNASADDWRRCDPRREDFFGSFGCEDVRRERQQALEAELSRLQNQYEELVIEGAALDRRLAAYDRLKQALEDSLRASHQKITALETKLEDRRTSNRAMIEILSEMESIDGALTRVLAVRGHCLSPAAYREVQDARREWRRNIEIGKGIAEVGQTTSEVGELAAEALSWRRSLRVGFRFMGRAFGLLGFIMMFIPDEPPAATPPASAAPPPGSNDPLCLS